MKENEELFLDWKERLDKGLDGIMCLRIGIADWWPLLANSKGPVIWSHPLWKKTSRKGHYGCKHICIMLRMALFSHTLKQPKRSTRPSTHNRFSMFDHFCLVQICASWGHLPFSVLLWHHPAPFSQLETSITWPTTYFKRTVYKVLDFFA